MRIFRIKKLTLVLFDFEISTSISADPNFLVNLELMLCAKGEEKYLFKSFFPSFSEAFRVFNFVLSVLARKQAAFCECSEGMN